MRQGDLLVIHVRLTLISAILLAQVRAPPPREPEGAQAETNRTDLPAPLRGSMIFWPSYLGLKPQASMPAPLRG